MHAPARARTFCPVLRYRLTLGPALILLVLAVFWLDEVINRTPQPAALGDALGGRSTFPPGVALFAIAIIASPFVALELCRILRANDIRASLRVTLFAVVAGLLVSCLVPVTMPGSIAVAVVSSAALLVLIASLLQHSRNQTVQGVVAAAGGSLLAFVYLGLLFGFLLAIRREHTAWLTLGVLLLTKSCDIGAFFTGTLLGRHKLIVWLSPGKTWEGLAGGLALATLVGVLGAWLTQRSPSEAPLALWQGAVLGVTLGIAGQLGDLAASLFKRDAGLKDSAKTLPGFGGLLDVIDSPLLAAPVAYWMLKLFTLQAGG